MTNHLTKLHGTPEQIEAFLKAKAERITEFDRRIAAGEIKGVEEPPDLTPEDERILDKVWSEPVDGIKRLP